MPIAGVTKKSFPDRKQKKKYYSGDKLRRTKLSRVTVASVHPLWCVGVGMES